MTAADGRPRPQYGEYATPEEQLAHIKEPPPYMLEQHPAARAGTSVQGSGSVGPAAGPADRSDASSGPAASQQRTAAQPAGPRQQAMSRGIDRFATLGLLALGLYSVLTTLVTMTDLPGYLDHAMDQIGVGSYTSTPATGVVAAVISGVNILVWIAAAALATMSLRAGRVSFWIPLVAGVFVTLVTGVCYAVLLMNDPSFIDYVMRSA